MKKLSFKLQIWRLLTCFAFWKGFSIIFVFLIVLTHVCISTVEYYYKRRGPDFYFMILFVGGWHLVLGFLLGTHPDMMTEFLWSLMYLYWRREPHDRVEIFGLKIQTKYFPWVWIVLWKISGYRIIKIISGYFIGHLYDYLKYIMPETLGYSLLETPSIFYWIGAKMENRQAQQAEEVSAYKICQNYK